MFSERLPKLRKERGISQKQCAEILGIESSKYNKWENEKNRPDYDMDVNLQISLIHRPIICLEILMKDTRTNTKILINEKKSLWPRLAISS